MSAEIPPGLLDRTYGAELTSSYAAAVLWGIQCLQTFMYFNTYTDDPFILKILVVWTWLSDTVHQGLILSLEYSTLITHFGDLGPISQINKEVILQGFFTIFVSVPVQLFFLHRIWRLSGNKIIVPLFLLACIVLETVAGITYFQWALQKNATPAAILVGTKRATGIVYLITAASIDVVIAISMVYLLWSAKVHGLTQTRRMVTRLIVYSVNTGIWTALLAVFCAMTMIAYPTTFVFIGLYMPISALYCNTLLANLNIRQYVRGRPDVISLSAIPGSGTIEFRGQSGTTTTEPTPATRSTTVNLEQPSQTESEIKFRV
ncbi:hypothetical protein B0H14DRAFT_2756704 [Mycena olivaceomarginata]|uniref:DUF6534 domain-containing protein n=1 Tax=Mycena albidolilacea TaxID=1033008 RepID=A0AAD6YYN2_9AGAR|nr:hypothetical protein DFH08DRAFT_906316 [Mycena albidolilacea]KAJ7854305.1 hypothetical protein B0H14DRAFT_2756704 [Mycena olivaceomarginata]